MCDQCRERWGDAIYRAVHAFRDQWPDAEFGPAHVILSDFNCEPVFIDHALRDIPLWKARDAAGLVAVGSHHPGYVPPFGEHPDDELDATAAFLRDELLPLVRIREAEEDG